ncbi:hypothetical protein RRG08_065076 [Elysia crispata]|uniref:Uncharacterized protein n=1 Tax=Elysia crispata TaxID=231223 RepID=A0AAE0ZMS0_9GAST|nr:hypothetical protein RRG08_065076 [Elysia crispata]
MQGRGGGPGLGVNDRVDPARGIPTCLIRLRLSPVIGAVARRCLKLNVSVLLQGQAGPEGVTEVSGDEEKCERQ